MYLQTLPDHEKVLLQNFLFLSGDAHTTCEMIQDLQDLYMVSDGGAVDNHGSYGWVIALSNGTCLAQGHGVVYGHDPRSYRAEGYGAKASALFLWNLFQYCKRPMPDDAEDGGFIFHCDNEGLLKKLKLLRKHTTSHLSPFRIGHCINGTSYPCQDDNQAKEDLNLHAECGASSG
jgi:hypothetical protein